MLLIIQQKQIHIKLKKVEKEKWHAPKKCENYLEHFISFVLIIKITSCHTESTNYNLSSWHWFVWWPVASFFPRNKLYNQIENKIKFHPIWGS